MAIERSIREKLIKLGITEDSIKTELDPLENKGTLLLKKIFSMTTKEQFEKAQGFFKDDLENDVTKVKESNAILKEGLDKRIAIVREYENKLSSQVGELNNEFSKLFGEEISKKITNSLTINFEQSAELLKNNLENLKQKTQSEINKLIAERDLQAKELQKTRMGGSEKSREAKRKKIEELTQSLDNKNKLIEKEQKLLEIINKDETKLVQQHKEYGKEIEKTNKLLEQENANLLKIEEAYREIEKTNLELNKLAEATTEHMDGMLKSLNPNASGYSNSIFSSLASQMLILNSTGDKMTTQFGKLGGILNTQFASVFLDLKKNITGFFDYVYAQSIGKAVEFSKDFAELNKSTGGFGERAKEVTMQSTFAGMGNLATTEGLARYGMGIKELNKSYGELSNTMIGFNNLSVSAQQSLTVTTAKMENLGVATSTSGKLMQTFTSAFNKTGAGAEEALNKLAKDAIALNISVAQYFQQFESVLQKISGYADSADVIFKKLNAISLSAKMSVDSLLGITEGLKSFEGASKMVAGLNSALGGTSLRAAELIASDPADALLRIKEELDASGVAFSGLNIGMQRFIAESAGFQDVNEAAKFFNSSLSEMREQMDKTAASQEDLKKKQEESAAFQQKYKSLLDNLTILANKLMPIFNFLVDMMIKVSEIPVVGFLLPLITMFGLLWWSLARVYAAGANFFALIKGSATGFIDMAKNTKLGDAAYEKLSLTLTGVTRQANLATAALYRTSRAAAAANTASGAGVATQTASAVSTAGAVTTAAATAPIVAAATVPVAAATKAATPAIVSAAVGAETTIISSVAPAAATAGTAATGGIMAGIVGFLTGPIGIILGIIAIGYLLYKLFDRIMNFRKPLNPKAAVKDSGEPSDAVREKARELEVEEERPSSGAFLDNYDTPKGAAINTRIENSRNSTSTAFRESEKSQREVAQASMIERRDSTQRLEKAVTAMADRPVSVTGNISVVSQMEGNKVGEGVSKFLLRSNAPV